LPGGGERRLTGRAGLARKSGGDVRDQSKNWSRTAGGLVQGAGEVNSNERKALVRKAHLQMKRGGGKPNPRNLGQKTRRKK